MRLKYRLPAHKLSAIARIAGTRQASKAKKPRKVRRVAIPEPRPSAQEQMLTLATDMASRSNCLKVHVGAVITVDGRVRAVGYNGTVEDFLNCFDGGCARCRDKSIGRGKGLDRCICVHAEENAIASAARYGISVADADCWVTHEPCLQCTKLLIQAHVARVLWLVNYDYDDRSDHQDSRRELRESATTRRNMQFQQISMSSSPVLQQLEQRLDAFKRDAERYGAVRRVFVRSKGAKKRRSSAPSKRAASRARPHAGIARSSRPRTR
jgi:dCMP deaminase